MFKHRRLTEKYIINLISFLHKYITFAFFHELLQSIVRRKRNRGKLFNSKIFIRQFIFIRNFSKFGKIKLIRIFIKFSKFFLFLAIYDSTTSIQERSTKNNRTSLTSSCTKY